MKKRYAVAGLLVLILVLAPTSRLVLASISTNDPSVTSPRPDVVSVPTVTLRAASGAAIAFKTQNGKAIDNVPPQTLALPHLVLFRNDALTDPEERTLIVEVTSIPVISAGVTVTLEVMTQHGNPDADADAGERITVWRESQQVDKALNSTQTGGTVLFSHEFAETVMSEAEMIATPTDYFRVDITVTTPQHPATNPRHVFGEDYALLMENQSVTRLPKVQEESKGAAPDELIIYYCDMFPFQKSDDDVSTRLLRKDIPGFVRTQLVPQMVEAFRVETDVWGFPWYHAWTSYRRGEDAERLSVALTERETWFHGWAPFYARPGISINVNRGNNASYDSLADGIISSFYHELFHNLQRGINQHIGGDGDVDGQENAWQWFSEGTSVLASSVGQPAVHFGRSTAERYHAFNANHFLASGKKKYASLFPYAAVIYWRFLYEQCGGMKDGVENPATGMQVIRRALTALYSKDIVDIGSSTDLVENLPPIMDRALATSSCPFQTHEDSLIHFARAVGALRLDGGRCAGPGTPTGCGFYDPNKLYVDPPLNTITYTGVEQEVSGYLWNSFGMEFIDVVLDPAADGRPLKIKVQPAPGASAELRVELYKLMVSGSDAKPQRIPAQATAPEALTGASPDGHLTYTIPAVDTSQYNRLGLIITRVDAKERSDPFGEYTILLHPESEQGKAFRVRSAPRKRRGRCGTLGVEERGTGSASLLRL